MQPWGQAWVESRRGGGRTELCRFCPPLFFPVLPMAPSPPPLPQFCLLPKGRSGWLFMMGFSEVSGSLWISQRPCHVFLGVSPVSVPCSVLYLKCEELNASSSGFVDGLAVLLICPKALEHRLP